MAGMELILASNSPRRRELLTMLGLPHTVVPSGADEDVAGLPPEETVRELARRKARFVKDGRSGRCVIAADTIVVLDGRILGKPRDAEDAAAMLAGLSGRTHTVYTGLAVVTDQREIVTYDKADVTFRPMTPEQIRRYVATGEPMDKAGAYGLQGLGGVFVSRVEGCPSTVIGLPLPQLFDALEELGVLVF